MSDEESFVILGSSPMSSLELDGNGEHKPTPSTTSMESDTTGSNFSSLKKSQLNDLQSARETSTQTPEPMLEKSASSPQKSNIDNQKPSNKACSGSMYSSLVHVQTENCKENSIDTIKTSADLQKEPQIACVDVRKTPMTNTESESKLWSRSPQVLQKSDEELCISFEDCAISSPLNSKRQQKEDLNVSQKVASNSNPTTLEKTINGHHPEPSISVNNSLASSFIMGEINADVLKTSVYSQFPSISMQSSPEEIMKLQNMVTENMQLKVILEKVNSAMRFFHSSSLQWQEKMNNMESKYKQELDNCQKEIEMLRKENQTLQENLKNQIEALEIARQKDREETIKELSEKNSLVENMRAQIVKLEQHQLASFEFVVQNDNTKNGFDHFYISHDEHQLQIKELERKLSELYASNLDFKDIEKQYIDELNCLKVNLASAEELIKANRATIAQLHAQDQERLERIKQLEKISAEQNERIVLLEQQNEVYRKDFEIEQEGRSLVVKEKQHMLQDLKNLQKRNQELIEEHQKLVDNYEKRLNSSLKSGMHQSFVSTAAAPQTYFNNPQRPIRNLPSTSSNNSQTVSSHDVLHSCPICNKAFKSLTILQSHVNDCIDKN